MLKEKISVKYLIHLVSERPALWDRTSESYRDRSLKEISWHEICAYINEDFDHMPMQMRQEFSKMVSKKWTHVRDCWVKSMKNGYDDKTMKPAKPYIYHDELHFLQKMLKCQRRLDLLSKMDESEIDSYLFDDINSKFSQRSNVIANGNENENAKDNAKDGAILKRNVINENNQNDKEPKVVIEENSDFHSDADADDDDDDDDNDDWPLNNDNDNNNDNGNGMIDIKEENFNEQQLEKSEPLFRTRDYFKQETKMKENTINTKQLIQTNSINPPANINNISIDNSNNAVTTTTTTAATISNNCRLYNGNKLNQIMKRKLSNSGQQGKHDNSNIHGIEMQENRHWNFFKSILPSVNHLNDIETLEFQAGVINLLQKLRNQQLTQTNRMNAQRTNGDRKRKLVDECANFEWTACNVNLASQQQQQQQQQQRQQQKQKQQQQQKRKQQQKHQQHYRTRSHQRNVAGVDPLKSAVLDLTDSNGETILDDDSDIFI